MISDSPTRVLTLQEAHEACLRVGVDPQRIGRLPWRTEEQRRAIEAYKRAQEAETTTDREPEWQYRRAYIDGFRAAIAATEDMGVGLGKVIPRLERFVDVALEDWWRQDCAGEVPPPGAVLWWKEYGHVSTENIKQKAAKATESDHAP